MPDLHLGLRVEGECGALGSELTRQDKSDERRLNVDASNKIG